MDLKSRVFFRITTALALICFGMLFFTRPATSERIILIVSGITNTVCTMIGLILTVRSAQKEEKNKEEKR